MAKVCPGARSGIAISGAKADEPVPSIPCQSAAPPVRDLYFDQHRIGRSVEPWLGIVSEWFCLNSVRIPACDEDG